MGNKLWRDFYLKNQLECDRGRRLALRHDAFQAHLASAGEQGRAVGLDMLVETQAGRGPSNSHGSRGRAHPACACRI